MKVSVRLPFLTALAIVAGGRSCFAQEESKVDSVSSHLWMTLGHVFVHLLHRHVEEVTPATVADLSAQVKAANSDNAEFDEKTFDELVAAALRGTRDEVANSDSPQFNKEEFDNLVAATLRGAKDKVSDDGEDEDDDDDDEDDDEDSGEPRSLVKRDDDDKKRDDDDKKRDDDDKKRDDDDKKRDDDDKKPDDDDKKRDDDDKKRDDDDKKLDEDDYERCSKCMCVGTSRVRPKRVQRTVIRLRQSSPSPVAAVAGAPASTDSEVPVVQNLAISAVGGPTAARLRKREFGTALMFAAAGSLSGGVAVGLLPVTQAIFDIKTGPCGKSCSVMEARSVHKKGLQEYCIAP